MLDVKPDSFLKPVGFGKTLFNLSYPNRFPKPVRYLFQYILKIYKNRKRYLTGF